VRVRVRVRGRGRGRGRGRVLTEARLLTPAHALEKSVAAVRRGQE
jgi:hypothetical protein